MSDTLEVNSFVPAWTTLAADCAAEAATRDSRPNPWENKLVLVSIQRINHDCKGILFISSDIVRPVLLQVETTTIKINKKLKHNNPST